GARMSDATLIALTSALTVMAAARAAYVYLFDVLPARRELRERMSAAPTAAAEGRPQDILRARTLSTIPTLNALLQRVSVTAQLETLLTQAGLSLTVSNVLYLQAALTIGAFLLIQLELPMSVPLALASAVAVGVGLPILHL